MAKQGTILVVDDNKGILTAVQMLLGTCFEKVITISTPNKIKNTLHDENVDVVLLDMNFSAGINSGNEGLFWLSEIKKAYPSIQVVLFTAYADIDLAVRGIKEGATDFVVKPWDNAKLLETLQAAYQIRSANHKGGAGNKQLVSKVIRLGLAHDLLFERAPWLTGWRSGVPGSGLNALFMGLCVLTGVSPSPEAETFWAAQRIRFGETFAVFRQGVESSPSSR